MNKIKWISVGVVGSLFAVSHIGMIGYIASRKETPKLPSLNIPVGPYTSYKASVTDDSYVISYRANDPKTMYKTSKIKEKGGFLGLANEVKEVVEEYTMDGDVHIQKYQKGIHIFTCSIDTKLNKRKFIVPGLGDAGDRYMGT